MQLVSTGFLCMFAAAAMTVFIAHNHFSANATAGATGPVYSHPLSN